jgi:hypothetical protein
MRPVLTLVLFLAVLPRPALAGATLREGGFGALRSGEAVTPRAVPEPPRILLERLLRPAGPVAVPGPQARPKTLGDALVVSVDDGVDPVGAAWEAALRVSDGPAGASDAIAVRFPAQSLAIAPPFRVSAVIVGLDDWRGVATWPSVELWLEDALDPLMPRRGSASAIMSLDAATVGLVQGADTRPTAFVRARVPAAPGPVSVPDAWLSDGAFDDAFDAGDGPLADVSNDWLECGTTGCGTPLDVDVVAGQAVRNGGGDPLLLVKRPAEAVESLRTALDLDAHVSVRVMDGAAGFASAGVALRAVAVDAYYAVEYHDSPASVVVSAILPAPLGTVLLDTFPVASPSSGERLLDVTVTGVNPQVSIRVEVDGQLVGTTTDATYRLAGTSWGLVASDPTSSGEAWDDFRVERRPDVFAVVAFPPGTQAALPLDVSEDSLFVQPLLSTTDGTSFAPIVAPCNNPGNPFVQLEVEDTGSNRLFDREAHVVSVSVGCPTCRRAPQPCVANLSINEREVPVLTVGEPTTVSASWWNEHLDAMTDPLLLRASAWSGPCSAPTAMIGSATVAVADSPGQPGTPPGVTRADLLSFMPVDPGPYCILVEELHDSNGDCCPDGAETTPLLPACAGPCSPVPPTDSNPSTSVIVRDVNVEGTACEPKGEDVGRDGPSDLDADGDLDEINLDGASLRVRRGSGDTVVIDWAVVDALVPPAEYNVHLLEPATLHRSDCFLEQAPVAWRVVGAPPIVLDLPIAPPDSRWFLIAETECPGGVGVTDSAADDPSLGCP